MLLEFKSIKNKLRRRILEHSIYITLVVVLIPSYLYFELCIVLPVVAEQWSWVFCLHLFNSGFLLMNVLGNMIYGAFTNTSIKGINLERYNKENWTFCHVCECFTPPRSWHCATCDICILKRDHHCTFLISCVGHFNQRYFMLLNLHMFIAAIYALHYNIQFMLVTFTFNYILLLNFLFPLLSIVIDFKDESIFAALVVFNLIVACFTGFLFIYHLNNILRGRVVHEKNRGLRNFVHNQGWKQNLIEVFGKRWYLTWISPFIKSKLPGNGIEWTIQEKNQ